MEIFAVPEFSEHIFSKSRTLNDSLFDKHFSKKWHLNNFQGMRNEHLTPSLIMFDQQRAGMEGSDW